jgi:hypothetical protein
MFLSLVLDINNNVIRHPRHGVPIRSKDVAAALIRNKKDRL